MIKKHINFNLKYPVQNIPPNQSNIFVNTLNVLND